MKKNIFKVLTAAFALGLFVVSPSTTMTAHAIGFNADAGADDTDYGDMSDDYWGSSDSGSNDSSYTEPSQPEYTEPGQTEYTEPSQPEEPVQSADNGSSNSESNSGSSSNTSTNTASSGGYTSPALTKNLNNVTVKVDGGQKFRITANTERTVYNIYHCGISRASFKATDADGNAAAFSTVTLAKGDDGLWYLNVTFAEGVDTEGLTMTVTKGDATYLSTELGVSGIKINGTAVLSTVPAAETK